MNNNMYSNLEKAMDNSPHRAAYVQHVQVSCDLWYRPYGL
jgi:hypothetical protein